MLAYKFFTWVETSESLFRWLLLPFAYLSMCPLPGDKRRTLKWVNRQREEVGLEILPDLRKGEKQYSHSCPIANSLQNGWYADTELADTTLTKAGHNEQRILPHPRYVRSFIFWFDRGFHRQLALPRR